MRNSIFQPGKWLIVALAAFGVAMLTRGGLTGADDHAEGPQAWRSMATAELRITPPDAPTQRLKVRVADDRAERAQGMQHLPAQVIRDQPIWFVFAEPRQVGWHMRNVRLALDIAYVDAEGQVIGVERMAPDGGGYGHEQPIAAALEVAAGQAKRLGIREGTQLAID